MYFTNEDVGLLDNIKNKLGEISLEKKEDILSLIEKSNNIDFGGVRHIDVKVRIISYLNLFSEVKKFHKYCASLISSGTIENTEKGLCFDIDNQSVIFNEFISKYKKLLELFKGYTVDVSLLEFVPNKKLSSGEKSILSMYSSFYAYINKIKNKPHMCYENYLLLLDEPELGYHPEWKRKFIHAITKTLPVIFSRVNPKLLKDTSLIPSELENPNIQVIFTTHDPLTLSDIPSDNIVYLAKKESITVIENESTKKTFGANIYDLLADSFFLKDGFMGEFAQGIITDLITFLDKKRDISHSEKKYIIKNNWDERSSKEYINTIDEPFIKQRLQSLFDENFLDNDMQSLIEKKAEIDLLINKMNNATNQNNN